MANSLHPRRNNLLLFLLLLVATFLALLYRFGNSARRVGDQASEALVATRLKVPTHVLNGDVIAPKLGDETLKAELGRASWKLFHTMMARFPDKPTHDESSALRAYILLFARLYPCGECAQHFRQILAQFPPQVSSRSAAAAWACHVHNEVNKSLKKDLFDCSKIGDFYKCGCAGDDEDTKGSGKAGR